jgi:hypothetical protein
MRYLASTLGVTLYPIGDNGERSWVVAPLAGDSACVLRAGAAGRWVVAAPRVERAGDALAAACQLYGRLDAPALWISAPAAAGAGTADPERQDGDGRLELELSEQLALRELLRPRAGLEPRAARGLVRLRRASRTGQASAMLALSGEALLPTQREPVARLVQELRQYWPGLVLDEGKLRALPLVAYGDPALSYANTVAGGRGAVLWLAPELLEEVSGHPEKRERLRLYRSLGLPLIDQASARLLLEGEASDRHHSLPAALRPLQEHLTTGAVAPLRKLVASGLKPTFIDDGLRLRAIVQAKHWVCLAESEAQRVTRCWHRATGSSSAAAGRGS